MMNLYSVLFGVVALLCALWAAWLSLSRPLDLEWTAWWKILVLSRIRHLKKSSIAVVQTLKSPLTSVHFEVTERLLSGAQAQLRDEILALSAEDAQQHILDDPELLGASYRLSHIVGLAELCAWDQHSQDHVQRVFDHCRVAGLDCAIASQLAETWSAPFMEAELELTSLGTFLGQADQRLIFVAEGKSCQRLLEFMHCNPGLRDAVAAVLFFHPMLDGKWLAENFTHAAFDVEANQALPYFVWHFEDGPASNVQLETPPLAPSGWRSIEVIALGELASEAYDCPSVFLPCVSTVVAKRISA